MLDDNNQRKMVYQCKPNEARKTLGVYIAPDGNMDAQIEYMYNKACTFSSKLKHCRLTGHDALYAVNTRIMKTLQYPLPTLHLTKSECTKIMYPILSSLLGKMKIVRTIKREVLYGPRKYQGFGLTNLYVYQGCTQLAILLQFSTTTTELGRIHRITIDSLRLELGTTTFPLNLPYNQCCECATASWIKHVWKFCWEHKVRVQIDIPSFEPNR